MSIPLGPPTVATELPAPAKVRRGVGKLFYGESFWAPRYNLPMAYHAGGARFSISPLSVGSLYVNSKRGYLFFRTKIGEKANSLLSGLYLSKGYPWAYRPMAKKQLEVSFNVSISDASFLAISD